LPNLARRENTCRERSLRLYSLAPAIAVTYVVRETGAGHFFQRFK